MSDGADSYFAAMGVEIADDLKHYGKKGMKWGVRKSPEARAEKKAQKKNSRELDKASLKRDIADEHSRIDSARKRVLSGKTQADFSKAKEQYKQDRITLGKREATKALDAAKNQRLEDYKTSQRIKDDRELVSVLLRGTDWNGIPFTAAKDLAKS